MRVHRFALAPVAAAVLLLLSAVPAFGAPATTAEETAPELAYSGAWYSWSSADLSGGAYRYANGPGAAVTVAFDGEGIELVARKGPEFGIASVTIDGGAPVSVDLYSEETTTQKIAFSASGLPASEHTARIAWTGARNPASAGTFINIDAVHVTGPGLVYPFVRFEEPSAPFAFEGLWSVWASPALSGGAYAFGDHPSSACTIAFDGTSLSLLARTGPEFGIASVSIDGGARVDVDLYSAVTALQAVVFTTGDLAAGPHLVRVEHTGRKNIASSGTYISIDAADIRGAAAAEPVAPVLVESDDPRVSYSGAWRTYSSAALLGGSYRFAGSPGSSVAFTFDGTRLDLIGRVGPEFGIAYVSIDGGPARKVDFYCAETRYQQVVYSTWDLPSGPHVVKMTWSGTRSAAASGTFVGIDAARVVGTVTGGPVEETDYRIVRLGGWGGWSSPALSGGSYLYTNSAGGAAVVEFEGDRFDWITRTGPEFGIAAVSIDGAAPVDVDLYAATNAYRQRAFTSGPLASGPHRVTITWTGRRNAAATGTYVGLDAVDVGGHLTQAIVRAENGDPRLGANGQWAAWGSPALSGGVYAYTDTYGAIVNVSFVGTSLDWIARTGPEFGIISVSLDGGPATEVDLYTPDTFFQQAVYSTGELPFGLHTLRVARTGRANPASAGAYMNLDALDVAGVLVQAPMPLSLTFDYPWSRYIVIDKSDFRLYLVEDGVAVMTYPVAVGAVGATTPNAIWRVGAKYYPDPGSVYGPRKMRLFRQVGSSYIFTAYAIHGTNNSASIGTRASHGCIRLYNEDILELFEIVPIGTMVVTRD